MKSAQLYFPWSVAEIGLLVELVPFTQRVQVEPLKQFQLQSPISNGHVSGTTTSRGATSRDKDLQ